MKFVLPPFWKGIFYKGKNLLPSEQILCSQASKFFPFRADPSSEGTWYLQKQRETHKGCLPLKKCRKIYRVRSLYVGKESHVGLCDCASWFGPYFLAHVIKAIFSCCNSDVFFLETGHTHFVLVKQAFPYYTYYWFSFFFFFFFFFFLLHI